MDAPHHDPHDDLPPPSGRRRGGRFLRAKLRHAVLTRTADVLALGALGRRHAAQPIEVRTVEVRAAGWPREHDGLRIAHVTDFHLGHLMPADRAIDAVERVAALRPHLLACTGDVVDLELDGCGGLLKAMGQVDAPLGRFLVMGNHDHLDDAASLGRMAARRGLRVLHGKVEDVGTAQAPLLVGGVDWGRTQRELARAVDALPQAPHLLLAHNPKAFPAAAARGIFPRRQAASGTGGAERERGRRGARTWWRRCCAARACRPTSVRCPRRARRCSPSPRSRSRRC
jgi:hypothetical protein